MTSLLSPKILTDDAAFQAWRDAKLAAHPSELNDLVVTIHDPASPGQAVLDSLRANCRAANFSVIAFEPGLTNPESQLRQLGSQLGLDRLDHNLCSEDSGLSALTVRDTHTDHVYIPYTNRPLTWHTDGYYNPPERTIRGFLLYCAAPAAEGGESELMDHEIAFLRLRERDPEATRALFQPDSFTIPFNQEGGEQIRDDQPSPVFLFEGDHLMMRYTGRTRNIIWKDDPLVQRGAALLKELFQEGDDLLFRTRLKAGQGVLSNNILHRRDGFTDAPEQGLKRLYYRARYYDRVN